MTKMEPSANEDETLAVNSSSSSAAPAAVVDGASFWMAQAWAHKQQWESQPFDQYVDQVQVQVQQQQQQYVDYAMPVGVGPWYQQWYAWQMQNAQQFGANGYSNYGYNQWGWYYDQYSWMQYGYGQPHQQMYGTMGSPNPMWMQNQNENHENDLEQIDLEEKYGVQELTTGKDAAKQENKNFYSANRNVKRAQHAMHVAKMNETDEVDASAFWNSQSWIANINEDFIWKQNQRQHQHQQTQTNGQFTFTTTTTNGQYWEQAQYQNTDLISASEQDWDQYSTTITQSPTQKQSHIEDISDIETEIQDKRWREKGQSSDGEDTETDNENSNSNTNTDNNTNTLNSEDDESPGNCRFNFGALGKAQKQWWQKQRKNSSNFDWQSTWQPNILSPWQWPWWQPCQTFNLNADAVEFQMPPSFIQNQNNSVEQQQLQAVDPGSPTDSVGIDPSLINFNQNVSPAHSHCTPATSPMVAASIWWNWFASPGPSPQSSRSVASTPRSGMLPSSSPNESWNEQYEQTTLTQSAMPANFGLQDHEQWQNQTDQYDQNYVDKQQGNQNYQQQQSKLPQLGNALWGCYDIGSNQLSEEDWRVTEVHYHKTYKTMDEILSTLKIVVFNRYLGKEICVKQEEEDKLKRQWLKELEEKQTQSDDENKNTSCKFNFFDFGCAPGGFAARLLEHPDCNQGYGITLPRDRGGYTMLLWNERFFVNAADIFDIRTADDLICWEKINMINCDMQDLSMQRDQYAEDTERGVRRKGVWSLPIWALTTKQFALGLSKLAKGGILNFRFGWRGYAEEKSWYQDCAQILFYFLLEMFDYVYPFKSEYFHQADPTFYWVCCGFNPQKFEKSKMSKLDTEKNISLLRSKKGNKRGTHSLQGAKHKYVYNTWKESLVALPKHIMQLESELHLRELLAQHLLSQEAYLMLSPHWARHKEIDRLKTLQRLQEQNWLYQQYQMQYDQYWDWNKPYEQNDKAWIQKSKNQIQNQQLDTAPANTISITNAGIEKGLKELKTSRCPYLGWIRNHMLHISQQEMTFLQLAQQQRDNHSQFFDDQWRDRFLASSDCYKNQFQNDVQLQERIKQKQVLYVQKAEKQWHFDLNLKTNAKAKSSKQNQRSSIEARAQPQIFIADVNDLDSEDEDIINENAEQEQMLSSKENKHQDQSQSSSSQSQNQQSSSFQTQQQMQLQQSQNQQNQIHFTSNYIERKFFWEQWRVQTIVKDVLPMAEFTKKTQRIEEVLNHVAMLREIHVQGRQKTEKVQECALKITPLDPKLNRMQFRTKLQKFGKVLYVDRIEHAIGSGFDGVAIFGNHSHLQTVLHAINDPTVNAMGKGVEASEMELTGAMRKEYTQNMRLMWIQGKRGQDKGSGGKGGKGKGGGKGGNKGSSQQDRFEPGNFGERLKQHKQERREKARWQEQQELEYEISQGIQGQAFLKHQKQKDKVSNSKDKLQRKEKEKESISKGKKKKHKKSYSDWNYDDEKW